MAGQTGQRGRRPTIRDVAARAGVSYQTVSRALNEHPSIKASTKERVVAAIAELGYRPSEAARALVRQKTLTIGVLSVPSTNYGPITQQLAIEEAARDAGYRIAHTNARSFAVGDLARGIDFLHSMRVDGLVVQVATTTMFDALRQLPVSVPYVTLEPTGLAFGHSVAVDQRAGARLAMEHLASLGHRRILHVRGPRPWIDANARQLESREVVRELGLEPLREAAGDWSADSGYRVGLEVLPKRECTAVFAGNDQMALGLLHACSDLGIDVPGELSIVGFDDVPEAAHFPTPLTTVRQPFAEVGARAVEILLGELQGTEGLVHAHVAPRLVERASTARLG